MKRLLKTKKLNNNGDSLVLVIVVIAFLSILATTLLYISGQNYIMKATERKTTENFYRAETGLEEVKAGMEKLCGECAKKAYVDTMIKYTVASSFTRYETFQKVYFEDLEKMWNDLLSDPATPTYLDVLNSYVEDDYNFGVSGSHGKIEITDTTFNGALDTSQISTGYVYLRGVKLTYTNDDGFTTQILTDFVFTVPDMNWSVNDSYTVDNPSATDEKDKRKEYDISKYVNYANWQKISN